MLDFGNISVVEKTFTRTGGVSRKQAYNGIKFRRTASKKGGVEGIDTFFVVSNHLFEKLGLATNALTQIALPDGSVGLIVVEDQDKLEPVAKFMRQSKKTDGTFQKKGKTINNDILRDALIAAGTLSADAMGSQFLTLESVAASNVPAHVKGVYKIVVDATVNAAEAEAEEGQTESVESDDQNF
jgi:hypothetical protein